MQLKEFKAGIDALARMINQREKEPAPFVIQVGQDHGLSIIAGTSKDTLVWRTGISLPDHSPVREAFSSKALIQAAKVLKGKDVTVQFVVNDDALIIRTSAGGSVKMTYSSDIPTLFRPPKGEPIATLEIDRPKEWADALDTTSGDVMDEVQFANQCIQSSDGYKVVEFRSMDLVLDKIFTARASALMPLRAATSHAKARIYKSGLQVRFDQFELSTGILDGLEYVSFRERFFPYGQVPDVYFVVDRKQFMGSIKAVAPVTKEQQVRIVRSGDTAELQGLQFDNTVSLKVMKGKGEGKRSFSAAYALQIMDAMTGKEIIMAWNQSSGQPLLFQDTSYQRASFMLAPVSRT